MVVARMANALASHPLVQKEIHELGRVVQFGLKVYGEFQPLHDVRIVDGHATYRTGLYQLQRYSLTEEIKRLTYLKSVRWLNHLYFKDGFGRIVPLKSFVAEKHGLHFS